MAKFLGAYVVAFGVMMLFIAKDPVRYSALVYPAVVVAVLRRSKGFLYVGMMFTASILQFKSTILSNFACSLGFCLTYRE